MKVDPAPGLVYSRERFRKQMIDAFKFQSLQSPAAASARTSDEWNSLPTNFFPDICLLFIVYMGLSTVKCCPTAPVSSLGCIARVASLEDAYLLVDVEQDFHNNIQYNEMQPMPGNVFFNTGETLLGYTT